MKTFLYIFISFMRPAALAIALIIAGTGRAFASSMTVNDPRPVAKAIEEIEKLSGKPVTYEDPPYLYLGTTIDVSKTVSRTGAADGPPGPVLIPKGGVLAFTLPADNSADTEFRAVEGMVKIYNARDDAAIFSAWRSDKLTHVVPQLAVSSSGRLEPVTPVLDSSITLETKPRTGLALLEEICQSVSAASGERVEIATVPANALSNQEITIGADDEPTRAVLEKLIVANATPLSWELFYDPGLKTYYLNIPIITQTAANP